MLRLSVFVVSLLVFASLYLTGAEPAIAVGADGLGEGNEQWVEARKALPGAVPVALRGTSTSTDSTPTGVASSLSSAAQVLAQAALTAATAEAQDEKGGSEDKEGPQVLSLEGTPGDVRLVCMTTGVIRRKKTIVPRLPVPPFSTWRKWLHENQHTARHCALDWMDDQGRWWHTEIRGFDHHPARFRVGQGEFTASGVTIYGVFIMPGRTDPEDQEVIFDEKIECDYRIIEREARKYGRKDKKRGDPGTGGNGEENVGLGGPAFRPAQNSNTYVHYLLRQAGVERKEPEGAVGWDAIPHFPYSSDADVYGP